MAWPPCSPPAHDRRDRLGRAFLPPQGEAFGGGRCLLAGLPAWQTVGGKKENVRRPVSRVLYRFRGDDHSSGMCVATHLARPTRTAMRKTSPAVPIWSCSRWGLPCRLCCQSRGALLPHHFNLAGPNLPKKTGALGGVISVALSLGSPPPAVNRHRLSVEPGLSSNGLPRPRSSGRLTPILYGDFRPAQNPRSPPRAAAWYRTAARWRPSRRPKAGSRCSPG